MKRFVMVAIVLLGANIVAAEPTKDKEVIKKVEATFEPANAKPGQTVTLKITVALADGYHTYPVMQVAPEAKFSTNKVTFPAEGSIVFVGDTIDPVAPKSKMEEDYELLYYPGGGIWLRKAVIAPNAKAGATTATIKFRLLICDKDNCFPPKNLELQATVNVAEGPAVEVEKAYRDEVEKALKK